MSPTVVDGLLPVIGKDCCKPAEPTDAELDRIFEEAIWRSERNDILRRFTAELTRVTGDGSKKRQAGTKPVWYLDGDHERAIFSHITKWKAGELRDPDSGAHPLVHAAWRCLAIACKETGNYPEASGGNDDSTE